MSTAKYHARLEYWRRLGLDAAQDPIDDTIKWRSIIFFSLINLCALTAVVVLCFNVIPNGAFTWTDENWGVYQSSGTCEYENTEKMIHQMFTAISAFGYMFVGIWIGLLSWLDIVIIWERYQARKRDVPQRPYCKGPDGLQHIKVTAIASHKINDIHPTFVSVDPDYLSGSVPSLLRREPVWGLLFSFSISFLGVGGYLNHASNTSLGVHLDYVAWFCVGTAFTSYSFARCLVDGPSPRTNVCGFCEPCGVVCRVHCDSKSRKRSSKISTFILVIITLAIDVVSGFFFNFNDQNILWISFSVMLIVSSIFIGAHYFGRKGEVEVWFELGLFAGLFFSIALLFLHYDLIALCINPTGYFQAHAVWHSLSAVALGFSYLAFRSDMWMYDLVLATEEKSRPDLEEFYRELEFDANSPQSFRAGDARRQSDPRRLSAHAQRRTVEIDETLPKPPPSAPLPPYPPPQRRSLDQSNDSATRRRTLERNDSQSGGASRPRTLEREDSESSRNSSRRLENLRAQAKNRDSRKTQKTLDSDSEMGSSIGMAFWTCPECAFEDNEISYLVCERCQAERPPLDEFVPVSVVQGYI